MERGPSFASDVALGSTLVREDAEHFLVDYDGLCGCVIGSALGARGFDCEPEDPIGWAWYTYPLARMKMKAFPGTLIEWALPVEAITVAQAVSIVHNDAKLTRLEIMHQLEAMERWAVEAGLIEIEQVQAVAVPVEVGT